MKKRFKSLSIALSLMLGVSVMVSGCGSTNDKATDKKEDTKKTDTKKDDKSAEKPAEKTAEKASGKLLFWHTYSDAEEKVFNDEVITAFKKENSDVEVEVVRMPYDGLKQQLITAIAGEAAPDLMRMDLIWVPEFAKMGALEGLEGKEGFDTIKNSVYQGSLNTNLFNGKYYGLPLNTNTKVAIYNKAVLEEVGAKEAPKTFDELIELAKKLKDKDDKWGIGIGGAGPWAMGPYFWSLGGKITNDDYTKATGFVNSDESVKALEKIVSLYKEGLLGPCIIGEEPNTWGGMEASNYLMIDDGPWFFSMQKEKGIEDKVLAALMPTGPGGSHSIIGGEDIVMFKGSKNKTAAWELMKFTLGDTAQIAMGKTGLIPTLKSAAAADEFKNDAINQVYVKQLETALPRTPHPGWAKIEEHFQLAFEKAIRNEGQPKELLDELAAKIDEALNE